jgi:hypothetical protein
MNSTVPPPADRRRPLLRDAQVPGPPAADAQVLRGGHAEAHGLSEGVHVSGAVGRQWAVMAEEVVDGWTPLLCHCVLMCILRNVLFWSQDEKLGMFALLKEEENGQSAGSTNT